MFYENFEIINRKIRQNCKTLEMQILNFKTDMNWLACILGIDRRKCSLAIKTEI